MKTKVETGTAKFRNICDYCPSERKAKFYFTVNIDDISESEFHEIREGDLAKRIEGALSNRINYDENYNTVIVDKLKIDNKHLLEENERLEKENKNLYEVVEALSKDVKPKEGESFVKPSINYTNKDEELREFIRNLFKTK